MGQRLNIEILCDGEPIANSYFHWSAYTSPALGLTEEIIRYYEETSEIVPLRIAVDILQKIGAGINDDERSRINSDETGKFKNIEFVDAKSRNDGLIAVTQQSMDETRAWEEGRVEIDIWRETVNFMVFIEVSDEEYEEGRDEGSAASVPGVDFDFYSLCKFKDFLKLVNIVESNPYGVRIGNNRIIEWIE